MVRFVWHQGSKWGPAIRRKCKAKSCFVLSDSDHPLQALSKFDDSDPPGDFPKSNLSFWTSSCVRSRLKKHQTRWPRIGHVFICRNPNTDPILRLAAKNSSDACLRPSVCLSADLLLALLVTRQRACPKEAARRLPVQTAISSR